MVRQAHHAAPRRSPSLRENYRLNSLIVLGTLVCPERNSDGHRSLVDITFAACYSESAHMRSSWENVQIRLSGIPLLGMLIPHSVYG
jgi:hypothetical protein